MRGGDRSKYAARNVRYESQRIRIVLITMGCFLMTMTFILSTKPGAVSIDTSKSDAAESFAPPKTSKPQDNIELQIAQIREDLQSNRAEPQIKPPKETTNFGAVAVDLEPLVGHNREDLQLEKTKTEIKPIEQTKIFGDIDSVSQVTVTGDVEPKSDTEKFIFPEAGGDTEFGKVAEENSEQNNNFQTTLIDVTNFEEKKSEHIQLGNEENKEKNSAEVEEKPAQIPTLLDRFNEIKPIDLEKLVDGENKENDNEKTEADFPALLDRFNENPAQPKLKESGSEKFVEQWFVTNPHKTEETTSSIQIETAKEIPISSSLQCDFTDFRSDTCNLEGDIRIHSNSSSIYFVDPTGSSNQFYNIKPYPRKGDELCYHRVQEFNVTSRKEAPQCTQTSDVPAILFSIGGYTGNIFHDFSDVIMPLFTVSRPLNGKVQFLMTNTQTWWLIKYDKILKALSHFEPIRLDVDEANNEVHCFKRVIVGLVAHRELIIEPLRNPNHYSTQDFTRFLRQIFPLEREAPTQLGEIAMKKPRMLIISRARSRMITNLRQVVSLCQDLGFEVVVQETDVGNDIIQFAQVINSCDVMIGVHGAGLTNEMFLPPNGTLIQIVPYGGLDWIGQMDYGDPAIAMGLNYIQYSIALEESSLLEKYGRENEILKNPIEFHKRGFGFIHQFFMNGQNITINLNRFRNVLISTLDKLTI
ncbi:Glycosyltransferase family 61 protein [Rhynchospora pubera]|uniref:Glycosyltransferase family 61 protein n=1 Tax=Rhynchospora pubera TaxID=906938 RepID=A0AAV8CAM0_9POAL|nr:Glycosyltransferase family 61 protein [Rhynchospora pubera]